MKRFRSTLLLLAAVLAVGAWWWRDQARPDTSNPLRLEAASVRGVRLQEGTRALVLARLGLDRWTVRSENAKKTIVPDAPADVAAINELLGAWAGARPSTVRADQPAKLAELGLGPNARTLLIQSNEADLKISIGSRVPVDPRLFYARVQSGQGTTIALLPQSVLAPLDRSILDWRDRQILTFDLDKITRIEVTSRGASTTLKRRGTSASSASTWRWQRAGAGDFPADPAEVSSAVRLLQGLRAQNFAPRSRAVASREAISIRLRSEPGASITARLDVDGSKTARATSSRLPDVAIVEAESARDLAAFWKRPAPLWRQKALFEFGVDEASEISVRARGREGKWIKTGDREWQRQPAAPTPASQAGQEDAERTRNAITDLLQQMSTLKARGFEDVTPARRARAGTKILEIRVRTPRGEQVLEVEREGTKYPVARVASTSRDDDQSTLFVLEDEALEPFQLGLRNLLR